MDAALYCRISHVDDASTVGVDRQEADGRRLVEARGWTVAAVHIDNNRSAWKRSRRRPGWNALLDDIRGRRVDVVVVAHPDRLIRQPRDLEDLLDLARDTGVQLVSAGGNRDLSNPDDVFILRIEVAHACRSSDDTSRRVRRGHEAAAAAGRPGGGTGRHRAYGYERDQLTVIDAEKEIVVEAARRVLEGEPVGAIARDLNDRHVPTVSGTPWSRTVLSGILRSPRTAGLRERNGQVVGRAVWTPLLDRHTWETVRAAIAHPAMPPGNNRRKYLLSGLIRCAHCEVPMNSRTGNPPGYGCPVCIARVARPHLDRYVIEHLVAMLADPRVRARLAADEAPDDTADEKVLADGQRRLDRIYDEWEELGASKEWVQRKTTEITAEMDRARARIIGRHRRSGLDDLPPLDDPEAFEALPLATQRALVRRLLPELTVSRTTRRGRGFDPDRVAFERPPASPAAVAGA